MENIHETHTVADGQTALEITTMPQPDGVVKTTEGKVTVSFDNEEGVVLISQKEKGIHKKMAYMIKRLKSGQPVTLQAYGLAINTAIWFASMIRNKIGDLHQITTLLEMKVEKRLTQGIQILISPSALDGFNVGY